MGQISVVTGSDTKLSSNILSEIGNEFPVIVSDKEINLLTTNENEKVKIADILSKVIMDEYENKILLKLIEQNYYYFTKPEKRRIYKIALKYLISDNNLLISYMQKRRSQLIKDKLKEYMNTSNNIVIDGFVNFRLKEYENELQDIIVRAVDDFMVEKEYMEFIKLLQYFVAVQKPKYNLMHIIASDSGEYKILDENHEDITQKCTEEFKVEENDLLLKSDDLLLSVLISTSPLKIIFHQIDNVKNKEITKTILSVFGKRVVKCNNCEICAKND